MRMGVDSVPRTRLGRGRAGYSLFIIKANDGKGNPFSELFERNYASQSVIDAPVGAPVSESIWNRRTMAVWVVPGTW